MAGTDEPEPEDPVSVVVTEDALTPLPAPIDGERPPPEDARALPVAADTIEETSLATLLAEDGFAVAVEAVELAELVTAEQLRSKRGVVLNVLPTIPKLGLGVLAASESERVYQ